MCRLEKMTEVSVPPCHSNISGSRQRRRHNERSRLAKEEEMPALMEDFTFHAVVSS